MMRMCDFRCGVSGVVCLKLLCEEFGLVLCQYESKQHDVTIEF